jgi:NhaP-type Na+/H+ or K+/H+ antiporter
MIPTLTWLECLVCAACVTATDPVLASSVVGKGKFSKRIPKHLRDLLSAESGCNDGMAFPFIYFSLYLIEYRPNAGKILQNWICLTVLYECVLGAIYGVAVGYAGRHAIKFAERKNLIDRESFLVFYFVLALWCAGTGSLLGFDDLLVGFCCGVAFSNDGWFSQKTEESHVSNVIDLLLNLAFFVYFGAIIPWSAYHQAVWGITPWRLIVIAILVILFRRIPIMVALKPMIPDIKTWREALFAGHFGPIGVGAIFVAILARAELEHGETTPLENLPGSGNSHYMLIKLIWPITTFLILTSIIIHGSSVAVFTLGKHINTMRITMSYTVANEEPNWLARLPRLTPRPSLSVRNTDESSDEKSGAYPPGTLPPPGGIPGGFLTKHSLGEESPLPSRPASIIAKRRRNWEAGHGPGGPISDSAISPQRIHSDPPTIAAAVPSNQPEAPNSGEVAIHAYHEGSNIVIENDQGDVIGKGKETDGTHKGHLGPFDVTRRFHPHERFPEGSPPIEVTDERTALQAARAETIERGGHHSRRRPAWAYRFDDNIIVEDEDGEVIRRYKLPKESRSGITRRGSFALKEWAQKMRGSHKGHEASVPDNDVADDNSDAKTIYSVRGHEPESSKGKGIHFRMHDERGRTLSKQQFLKKLRQMDPHARASMASSSTDIGDDDLATRLRVQTGAPSTSGLPHTPRRASNLAYGQSNPSPTGDTAAHSPSSPARSSGTKVNDIDDSGRDAETAAERRRREAALGIGQKAEDDSSDEEEHGIGRLETNQARRSAGIRFADQHIPAVSGESGNGSNQDSKGKGREV